MKTSAYKSFVILTTVAILSIATSVEAQGIRWAGSVDPIGSGTEKTLHAPDNNFAGLGNPLTMSNFGPTMRYSGLARLLGVSDAVLSRANVIAFEGNGGGGVGVDRGWESCNFTFSDGSSVRRVIFKAEIGASPHPGSDPAVIATGTITNAAYSSFFGMCSPLPDVISYILIDLHSSRPVINSASPSFSIKLENGLLPSGVVGEGATPDPDAIGIFSSCGSR